MSHRRPADLAAVAARSGSLNEFSFEFHDFLHEFTARPESGRLDEEPPLLRSSFEQGDVADAYLAAAAVFLAHSVQASPPEWAFAPDRYLRRPWFASPGSSMRACLLLESPAAFRERNLVVTANALSVA